MGSLDGLGLKLYNLLKEARFTAMLDFTSGPLPIIRASLLSSISQTVRLICNHLNVVLGHEQINKVKSATFPPREINEMIAYCIFRLVRCPPPLISAICFINGSSFETSKDTTFF